MPTKSYEEIADQTIRKFIRAVVLIDDHWSDVHTVPILRDLDLNNLNLDPQSIPPQESVDITNTSQVEGDPAISKDATDPSYLREIGKEITNQGYLFTGFSYTDAQSETAFKLAAKADILILDWHLGAVDSRPALSLLESLMNTGSPRFIFILTDQDLDEVRKQISKQLGETIEITDLVFSCGPFSFSIKNKPQAGGPNTVDPANVLIEAINGIREQFGGFLQLSALELLGQYRECLHEVLDQFHADTDLPFIMEWFEKESPIRDSHSFNELAIDEWTAMVTRRLSTSKAQTITDETVSAFLVNWKETITLPDKCEKKLKELIKDEKMTFPSCPKKVSDLMESLGEWMSLSKSCWPTNLKGASKKEPWSKSKQRILAINYLGLRKGVASPLEKLVDLDVLFQCQANLPLTLDQGTVLSDPDSNYLICITPACDCSRPSRIKNNYVFLKAQELDIIKLKDHVEGTVIAIRSGANNHLLAVDLNPTFTNKIANPSIGSEMIASFTYGSTDTFITKPVAQLRPTRVQSLVSLTAGKSIAVGIDRSELLRQLCKSNRIE